MRLARHPHRSRAGRAGHAERGRTRDAGRTAAIGGAGPGAAAKARARMSRTVTAIDAPTPSRLPVASPPTCRTPLWRSAGRPRPRPGRGLAEVLDALRVSGSFGRAACSTARAHWPLPAAGVVVASGMAMSASRRATGARAGLPKVFCPSEQRRQARRWACAGRHGARAGRHRYADALAACLARQRRETGALLHRLRPARGGGRRRHAGRRDRAGAGLPDRVLVSVGGGELIAGIAAWFGGRARVAAGFERAPPCAARRAVGRLDVAVSGIADSLARAASARSRGR